MSSPFAWTGRDDGPGPEHRRVHHVVRPDGAGPGDEPVDVALLGFASDEGVQRNKGRVGAAEGPAALRSAVASLAVHEELAVRDHGDVAVTGGDLEGGQARLGEAIAAARDGAPLTVVLGGGHETAYGSYCGLAADGHRPRLGILNLDAHFDLRQADEATSGTPFAQIARDRARAGAQMHYAVLGISRASNTTALFETAERVGARWLLDDDCQEVAPARAFVEEFLAGVDEVYLSIDLDVLPAAVAPGVSAPAALGVPVSVIQAVCDAVADSGTLVHLDVTELNPRLDLDSRTARVAARLVHRLMTRAVAARRAS
ncbi:formimidoylglutamase [Marihabitans asiaticum]|uniref:Formimidoylglutamase n=1 Tax=Marihabitans asiaticum TaxID=415218 RepID=A0A560WI81_9MICO|nr:formimidoylglutamase [Marihabitans asiaticum]TWD17268.1 formiminoglutamase [Marihabitans asiaticum]